MTSANGDAARVLGIDSAADDLVREFAGAYARETVTACLADSVERLGPVEVPRWRALLVYRFARDRLRAGALAAGLLPRTVPQVLFVCTHNAARSQLAAALLDAAAGGRVEVRSAGTDPAGEVDPAVVGLLAEEQLPVETAFPKPLTDEVVQAADVVVTVGCGDACPVLPGRRYVDWDLPDPVGADPATVRAVADEIDHRVHRLLGELLGPEPDAPATGDPARSGTGDAR